MLQVKNFIERWQNAGDKKGETQKFWLELLRDVLHIEKPEDFVSFEKRVALKHVCFIDTYVSSTGIIIEQKSSTVNLDIPAKQSYETFATPFEQAKRYYDWLPLSERGLFIVVCNFNEFRIHDMEQPKSDPAITPLKDITRDKLAFLVKTGKTLSHEVELSVKAGELAGRLYDALKIRYIKPDDRNSLRSLNIFCVRVVFLLYAEDSGLFSKGQFHDYVKARQNIARDALRRLFEVLNQKEHERDPYLEADLKEFPYVNGVLFSDENIEFPQLDGEPLRIILEDMSESFDWSGSSPTIFGAVFESTLNLEM